MTLDPIWPKWHPKRLTFRPGNYIWSLPWWIWTQMRHLGTSVPRFCTEFRYLLYGQSGLAWGAILSKMLGLSLIPRYPCSFFWERGPKMVSAPNVPTRKGHVSTNIYICIYIYIYICICICICFGLLKWLVFRYFEVQGSSKWLVMQYFQVQGSSKRLVLQYFQVQGSSKWLVFKYFTVQTSSKWRVSNETN